jgi:hypothetical protein
MKVPTNRFQTRMQVINPSPSAIYSGVTNAFTTITRIEGARSLWRGMTSVVVGAGTVETLNGIYNRC